MRVRGLFAFAIVAAVCASPAALAQGTESASVSAKIVDFDFAPKELTVDLNTTVEWSNTGARPHTVTDRGGTFDTNPVAPRGKASITFTVAGRYLYFCRINPSKMNGVLVVKPGAEAAKVVRVQAIDPARDGAQLAFDPPTLTVESGSTVLFANVGGKPHTLTADDGSFDTGVVTPGAEGGRFAGSNATFTVSKPGTHAFHCEVHPQVMKGTITVTGQRRAVPVAASTAPTKLTVQLADFEFKPAQASIAPNGLLTFQNRGQAQHTATFDDVSLDTKPLSPGSTAVAHAPEKPGSYSFHCNVHPAKMRGVLVVVGQNVPDPTKTQAGAAPPSTPSGRGGPEGGVTALALATGIVGAFLGGFAISAFVRNNMGQSAS